MFKKTYVDKMTLRNSCLLTFLMMFYMLASGCNGEIQPDCKHQFLTPAEASPFVYSGGDVTYFLRLDTSKFIRTNRPYNEISKFLKQSGINPRECAIQWGINEKNEISIFVGIDDNSVINKIFCSLLENKKNYFGEVPNLDSCKIVLLFSKVSWEKDKDGYEWPYVKGELKGLKEL
jgi:hypothetical protein